MKSPLTTAMRQGKTTVIDVLHTEDLRERYDAVVLGGGPSGATAAAVLARASLSVLLAEQAEGEAFKVGETIPGIASHVMTRAGFPNVLRRVAKVRCTGNRSIWGSSKVDARPGVLDPYGGGAHLDRAEFDRELLCEAAGAGVHVLKGTSFDHADKSDSGWMLFLKGRRKTYRIACGAVIDCTGRKACFARTQGARRVVVDKQVALASVLSGDAAFDNDLTTIIEATRDGWWYSARIPHGKRVVVFFSDGDLLRKQMARTSAGFSRLMEQSTQMREFLGKGYGIEHGPLAVLADTSYLTKAAGPGWCAAGDAAAALDPLASAGIIDGINGGVAAAGIVLSDFKRTEDHARDVIDRATKNIETRRAFYAMEKRWPEAPFWARRRGR